MTIPIADQIAWAESLVNDRRMPNRLRVMHRAVLETLRAVNSPEIAEFAAAVVNEARHQRARWGTDHDGGKGPEDWLWLIGYLCTKAMQAHRYGDTEKYLHHIITAGAALANWHASAIGADNRMRPGVDPAKVKP